MSHLYSGTALVTLTPAGLLERDMRAGVNQGERRSWNSRENEGNGLQAVENGQVEIISLLKEILEQIKG